MECPFCGAELVFKDVYGFLAAHQSGEVLGEIYVCPVGAEQCGKCVSESFSVAGAWHTKNGDLCEGYPC